MNTGALDKVSGARAGGKGMGRSRGGGREKREGESRDAKEAAFRSAAYDLLLRRVVTLRAEIFVALNSSRVQSASMG
eukprot:2404915-Pleurochrysis_carterae.AAC.2